VTFMAYGALTADLGLNTIIPCNADAKLRSRLQFSRAATLSLCSLRAPNSSFAYKH
jgi:hypothetical protein